MSIVDDAGASYHQTGKFRWEYDGVEANKVVSKKIVMRAEHNCKSSLDLEYTIKYYKTGRRAMSFPFIIGEGTYLPLMLKGR